MVQLEEHLPRSEQVAPTDKALAVLAMCFGALAMARSVEDEDLAERIITAARTFLLETI